MAENFNAKCSICGKPYRICHSCQETKLFTPWRAVTDSIECYKIYLAVHSYSISKDKKSAYEQLKKCDISGLEGFNETIRKSVNEILSYEKEIKPEKHDIRKKTKNPEDTIAENEQGIPDDNIE